MKPQFVTNENFKDKVLATSRDIPVMVAFGTSDCGPCEKLDTALDRVREHFRARIEYYKIDVKESPEIAEHYKLDSIPTVMIFINSRKVDEFVGVWPTEAIIDFIDQFFPSTSELLQKQAQSLANSKEGVRAKALLDMASLLDPENLEIKLDIVNLALDLGQIENAQHHFMSIKSKNTSKRLTMLAARLLLARNNQRSNNENSTASPVPDLNKYIKLGQHTIILDALLNRIQESQNSDKDTARKAMLAIFEMLGDHHPDVIYYRRQLASNLF
ncbi:MAG TPA: tetratricopeptide repeat protein [Burkholderiales bacterium]|nr:tetratricopeptide repeat protein [Burkholderiales bacterium]